MSEHERQRRRQRALEVATETLGDESRARAWIATPNRGLGGVAPEELLDTERGTDAVLAELHRLEHGIFS